MSVIQRANRRRPAAIEAGSIVRISGEIGRRFRVVRFFRGPGRREFVDVVELARSAGGLAGDLDSRPAFRAATFLVRGRSYRSRSGLMVRRRNLTLVSQARRCLARMPETSATD